MSAVLKVIDKHLGKPEEPSFELRLVSERITARELIRRRVDDEISQVRKGLLECSGRGGSGRSFLIRLEPGCVEAALNRPRQAPEPPAMEPAVEAEAAFEAFGARRYILLFDGRQVEDLDENLIVTPGSEAVFYRLTPLVGG